MSTARAVPGPGFKHWGVLGRAWGAQGVGWIAACAGRAQVDSGLVCPLAVTRGGCLSLARFLRARAAKWDPLGHGLWWGLPLGARVPGRHLARREHGRGRWGLAGHAHRLKLFTAFGGAPPKSSPKSLTASNKENDFWLRTHFPMLFVKSRHTYRLLSSRWRYRKHLQCCSRKLCQHPILPT